MKTITLYSFVKGFDNYVLFHLESDHVEDGAKESSQFYYELPGIPVFEDEPNNDQTPLNHKRRVKFSNAPIRV